jgi:hypothetical protein
VPAEHGEGESQEGAMPEHSKERTQAEAKFKKAQRATDGSQAMSEYNAERLLCWLGLFGDFLRRLFGQPQFF